MKYKCVIIFLAYVFPFFALNAEIPYSIDALLQYQQKSNPIFNSLHFWDSMKWQREETSNEFMNDKDVQAMEQNYIQFCQNFQSIPSQNYTIVPTTYSIPPIIHLIWLGSSIPPQVDAAFQSWEKHHPNWEIKIWTDKELINFLWSSERSLQAFNQASTWAEKADILRLEVLYKFGGVYSDADVVCLNSFQDLIVQDLAFFSCFELNYVGKHYGEPFFVGSAIMGASKNSYVMKYCLDHLQTENEAPDLGIIKRTGPGLISRACQSALFLNQEKILIFPCGYFYPLPWKKKETTSIDVLNFIGLESLAIHLWDGSWCIKRIKNKK